MKRKGRKILISSLFLAMLLFCTTMSMAVPKMMNIQLTPETPRPQDEITITADAEFYDYAKGVYFVLDEYKEDVVFTDGFNESMEHKGNGAYETKIQLKHEDATKIKYHFAINVQNYPGVKWTLSESMQLNLDLSMQRALDDDTGDDTNGETSQTSNTDSTSDNNTLGFEFIFLIIAIGIVIYFKNNNNQFN